MLGIVRPGRGFGMVLDGDDRQGVVAQAFDALVVEIDVRDFHFRRQTAGFYGKPMIVRSDLDVTVLEVFNRLIAAPMAEP